MSRVGGIGTYMHENMHVIRYAHENQRPDRDDYVTVPMDNIKGRWHRHSAHTVGI